MIIPSFSYLLLFFLSSVLAHQQLSADHEKWIAAVDKFDQISRITIKDFADQLSQLVSNDSIQLSSDCRHELGNFSAGLSAGRVRETAMFDSFSRINPGRMTFRGYDMGAYQQCLDLGRYVYLGINFPVPIDTSIKSLEVDGIDDWRLRLSKSISPRRLDPYHFGICVPDSCREEDLSALFSSQDVIKMIHPLTVEIRSTESKSDPVTYTITQALAILILLVIFHIGLAATAVNRFFPDWKESNAIVKLLQPFDFWINMKELFSSSTRNQSMYNNVSIYRSLYLLAGIFSHMPLNVTWAATAVRPEASAAVLANHLQRFDTNNVMTAGIPMNMVNNWIPAGAFATIKWLPVMRKRSVSFAFYALDRVFRTLPVIMTMLLILHILPLAPLVFGAGPLTKYTLRTITDVCNKNSWKELLFVNNFGDMRQICMPVAWFISAEFQIYCASFITIALLAKFPERSKIILGAQLVIGLAASGLLFYVTKVPAVSSFRTIDLHDLVTTFPVKMYHTINYVSVYTIGIILGHKLVDQGGKPQPMSLKSWICLLPAYYAAYPLPALLYFQEDGKYDSFAFGFVSELLFTTICRPLFAALVAIAFYGLINSDLRFISYLASTRFALVLTRLTLSFFMMHSFVVILLFASYESTVVSNIQMFLELLFILLVSFPWACLLHAFVEVPFAKLLSSLIRRPISEEGKKAD